MPAVAGSPTQNTTVAATPAELAGLPDDAFRDGDLAYVRSLWPQSSFRLRRTALGSTPNNVTAIATLSGNGYWELVPTGGNPITLADIAALAAFNDAYLDQGAAVYVESLRSYFQKGAFKTVATPTVTEVECASGAGTWYRTPVNSATWQSQASWHIDPTSGDDENDGSSTAAGGSPTYVGAIKTWGEFLRRMPVITIVTTVTFVGTTIEELRGSFKPGGPNAALLIQGTPTVFATGAGGTNTFVDPVTATNTRGTITCTNLIRQSDGAVINFDTCAGKLVRSPATDASSPFATFVLASVGGVAQHGWWTRTSLSSTAPAVGAAIEVLDLPTCPAICLTAESFSIQVRYMKVGSPYPDTTSINCVGEFFPNLGASSLLGKWFACEFTSRLLGGEGATTMNACLFSTTAQFLFLPSHSNLINGGGSTAAEFKVNAFGRCGIQRMLFQGSKLMVGDVGYAYSRGVAVQSTSCGFYGSPSNGIEVVGGAAFGAETLWGTSNNGYGIKVSSAGTVAIRSDQTPTLTGSSGDLNLSAAPNLAATNVVPIRDGVPTAPAIAMTTWATWNAARPGGLERCAVNLSDGTAITGK